MRQKRGALAFALTLCAVLLTSGPLLAAGPYDPAIAYRTILSPRFAVHYPAGAHNLALRVSRFAERIILRDAHLLRNLPEGRIEVVLTDNTDDANGFAQVLPKNMVTLYLSAPTELTGLSEYDDWLEILLTHELAHICDIDQTWNFTAVLRAVFGKYIQWNGYVPQFLSEGLAVFTETELTTTGRGRSSYVAMMLRMAALEDRFLEIDQATTLYPDWPGGNVAYFYGGRFHLWLADKLGVDTVAELHHYYAAQVVPYLYYFGARETLGASLPAMWEEFAAEEKAFGQEVRAAVERAGVTPSRRLTFHGRDITGARYSPDGKTVVYSRSSPVDGSTVRRMDRDGHGDTYLVLQTYSARLSFNPKGTAFYYAQAAINDRFDTWNDLYRFDLASGGVTRLKDHSNPDTPLRARDPAASPDGHTLVFVQNKLQQSWLSIATIINGNELVIKPLVGPVAEVQHAAPVFSPDGKYIAEQVWFNGGRRDILILDALSGALVRRVTYDRAQDGNPCWSHDGRYVLYESDADGISNLYAFDTQDLAYYRITHVVGGAFQPDVSPDGQFLLFRNASGIGFDIHEMPFAPGTWEPQRYDAATGYTPVSRPEPVQAPWAHEGVTASQPRESEPLVALGAYEEDQPYSPWRTLLPFQENWWLQPSIYFANLTDLQQASSAEVGFWLTTGGYDSLQHHSYGLSVGASRFGQHPNVSLWYNNDVWFPTFGLQLSDIATTYLVPGGHPVQISRAGSLTYSMTLGQRHFFEADYTFEARSSLRPQDASLLALGRFGSVGVGYQYSFAFVYPYSVGAEHGRSLAASLRWFNQGLGADFNELLLNLDGRLYINNPLFDNHVLALRLITALSAGPDYVERFYLGGTTGSSFITQENPRQYPLRGLNGLLPGTGVLAAYAEYRFPLWHAARGLWTLPIYLQTLHMAVFCDAGNTLGGQGALPLRELGTELGNSIRHIWSTIGAEVRADVYLGWAFGLTIRLGLGVPAVANGQGALRQPQLLPYIDFGTFI